MPQDRPKGWGPSLIINITIRYRNRYRGRGKGESDLPETAFRGPGRLVWSHSPPGLRGRSCFIPPLWEGRREAPETAGGHTPASDSFNVLLMPVKPLDRAARAGFVPSASITTVAPLSSTASAVTVLAVPALSVTSTPGRSCFQRRRPTDDGEAYLRAGGRGSKGSAASPRQSPMYAHWVGWLMVPKGP